jgi:hypothetical protein
MHEHQITLADIRSEAEALEFDIDTSTGFLDIRKRGDTSTAFHSLQGFDDPRVLVGAWEFLQHYRAQLDMFDEARREFANRPPERQRKPHTTLYRMAGFTLAIIIGLAIAQITGNPLLALLAYFCLSIITALIPARRKGAAHGGRR